ncbi:MAG: GIY-YIG nuclease family protein [Flavobacteriales bacterium]|nr:GIY-YIG nuclease family protein [Flavobacteriales bacterium]
MNWVVYILECSDGSYYTGITNNLAHRTTQHNLGKGAKYTRGRTPVVVKAQWPVSDKSAAIREEIRIKKLSRSAKSFLISDYKNRNSN